MSKKSKRELTQIGKDVYRAEKIMDTKYVKGVRHFLIKWDNWDHRHNTWEPEQNILDKSLINSFYKTLSQRINNDMTANNDAALKRKRTNSGNDNSDTEDNNKKTGSPAPSSSSSTTGANKKSNKFKLNHETSSTTTESDSVLARNIRQPLFKPALSSDAELARQAKREAEGLRPIGGSGSSSTVFKVSSSTSDVERKSKKKQLPRFKLKLAALKQRKPRKKQKQQTTSSTLSSSISSISSTGSAYSPSSEAATTDEDADDEEITKKPTSRIVKYSSDEEPEAIATLHKKRKTSALIHVKKRINTDGLSVATSTQSSVSDDASTTLTSSSTTTNDSASSTSSSSCLSDKLFIPKSSDNSVIVLDVTHGLVTVTIKELQLETI